MPSNFVADVFGILFVAAGPFAPLSESADAGEHWVIQPGRGVCVAVGIEVNMHKVIRSFGWRVLKEKGKWMMDHIFILMNYIH